jgi:hypothetical protein
MMMVDDDTRIEATSNSDPGGSSLDISIFARKGRTAPESFVPAANALQHFSSKCEVGADDVTTGHERIRRDFEGCFARNDRDRKSA